MIHLDTHVAVWLYAAEGGRLPAAVRERIEHSSLGVSPMVVLELQYLFETGRTTEPAAAVMRRLRTDVGLEASSAPFPAVIAAASGLDWTRDPFDRIIAGQAIADDVPLVTADRHLHEHLDRAVWD